MQEKYLVTIIGSSGRTERFNETIFSLAKKDCIEHIKNLPNDIENITLQSGGSSGIDHLAIILYLEGIEHNGHIKKFSGLKLYMPCSFDWINRKFTANNTSQASSSKLLNELHATFSKDIRRDTFNDLSVLKDDPNVVFEYGYGFFQRNRALAENSNNNCTTIAMTFGSGSNPLDGGTLYTWNLIKGHKIHIPLKREMLKEICSGN